MKTFFSFHADDKKNRVPVKSMRMGPTPRPSGLRPTDRSLVASAADLFNQAQIEEILVFSFQMADPGFRAGRGAVRIFRNLLSDKKTDGLGNVAKKKITPPNKNGILDALPCHRGGRPMVSVARTNSRPKSESIGRVPKAFSPWMGAHR